jgi:hypothetical protein
VKSKRASALVFLVLSAPSFAQDHWTAELSKLTVFENGSAFMIVSNPRNGTGTWSCTQNVVHIGVKNAAAPEKLLSQAMMAYVAAKTMRFGVRGTTDSCETNYVTAE